MKNKNLPAVKLNFDGDPDLPLGEVIHGSLAFANFLGGLAEAYPADDRQRLLNHIFLNYDLSSLSLNRLLDKLDEDFGNS